MERIQKILAKAGVASRRKCEDLIREGKVTVNGKVVVLGEKADEKASIRVDGKRVRVEKKVYIMLNKPKGFVTTVHEQHGMKTVMDLVRVKERVFPVGRLDKYTEGLLLFTNDGELANKLTHPRYEVVKEYYVVLEKALSEEQYKKLKAGIEIDGRKVAIKGFESEGKIARIAIHEGRKHIVRRLFEELGARVMRLIRTRMGRLELEELPQGKWRELTADEVKRLS